MPNTSLDQGPLALHNLLTGQPPRVPFHRSLPPATTEFPSDAPPALVEVCRLALAPARSARLATVDELDQRLAEIEMPKGGRDG